MTSDDREFSYDSIARDYARKVDSAPYNALYERPAMLGMLPAVSGLRVLDAGCGSGWYAERLLERGAVVEAIDSSAKMVEYARERFSSHPQDTRVRLNIQVADLSQHLPFDDGVFSGVLSPLVLHYLEDWRPALREFHRVLEPSGWLLLSTHHPGADAARFETENYFAVERVSDHWKWAGDVEFYRRSLTEISASLAETGFVIDRITEPVPTSEFRAAAPESWERVMRQPEFVIVKSTRRN